MGSTSPIHVVAGVIQDARGRILLARRTAGRDLAGLWEFPGGKVDDGETPEQALARELHEELGIRIGNSEPLIAVPSAYGNKRIVLDVRRIVTWSGTAVGREHQALAWVPPEKLLAYPMPLADRPVVAALRQSDRYLITPGLLNPEHFLRCIECALKSGIRRVQLRPGPLTPETLRPLAKAVQKLCRVAGAELLINADLELSRELGTGLHLRADQLMELRERPALGEGQLVAASCHEEVELKHADALGLDFVVLGPVAVTPSHPERKPLCWESFALMREQVSLPIYALGGMTIDSLSVARAHGAQGIAAIRGLWPS